MANLLKALRDKVTLTHLTFLFNSKLPTQPMPRPTTGLPVRLALVREADFDSGLLHKQIYSRPGTSWIHESRTSLLLHSHIRYDGGNAIPETHFWSSPSNKSDRLRGRNAYEMIAYHTMWSLPQGFDFKLEVSWNSHPVSPPKLDRGLIHCLHQKEDPINRYCVGSFRFHFLPLWFLRRLYE